MTRIQQVPCKDEESCEKMAPASKGYCNKHWRRRLNSGLEGPQCVREDCVKGAIGRGLCSRHYSEGRRKKTIASMACRVLDCSEVRHGKGYCKAHYDEAVVAGDVESFDCQWHEGCTNKARNMRYTEHGYCAAHYRAMRRAGLLGAVKCTVELCERYAEGFKYCAPHATQSSKWKMSHNEMEIFQKGVPCEICGMRAQAVDHNHKTNKVRGYLCIPCNTGIGSLQDNPAFLRAGAEYLDRVGTYAKHYSAEQIQDSFDNPTQLGKGRKWQMPEPPTENG